MERDTKHLMISVGFGDDGWSLACNKRRLCQSFMSSRISINEIKSVDWDKAAAISNRFKDYEWYMPIIYQKSGYKGGEWNFSYPKFLKDSKRQTSCKSMKANVWHLLLSCCILFGEFLLFSNSNSIKGRLKNSNTTAPGNGQYVVGYLAISGVHIYYLIKNEHVK